MGSSLTVGSRSHSFSQAAGAQGAPEGDHVAPEILDPYSQLCEIVLLGRRVKVPRGDLLLRCFQYIFGDRISYGRFCWNNECGNCEIRCRREGEDQERVVRACISESQDGLSITHVPLEFRVFMHAREEGGGRTGEGPTSGGGAAVG